MKQAELTLGKQVKMSNNDETTNSIMQTSFTE